MNILSWIPLLIVIALVFALAWYDLRKLGSYTVDLTQKSHKKGKRL